MIKRTLAVLVLAFAALTLAVGCGTEEEQDEARDATTQVTDTESAQDTLEELTESAAEELEDALTRDLHAQNGSGITGTAKLEPRSQDEIRVTIQLQGAESGASYPAHIHEGTCANLNPNPEYPLKNVVNGRSETTIKANPLELFSSEYAVNVHDAEDASRYVACADIPSAEG